jgi:hypothetical protein
VAMNLERYEILKRHLPEEAARVIAEAFPPADQLVTKDYLDARFADFGAQIRAEMHAGFDDVNGRMYRGFDAVNGRVLTMTVSLVAAQFVGVAGIIVAILLK